VDGFKERLTHSIQVRLAWGLSMAIVLVALVAGAFSFDAAFKEANELQDDILRQAAALVQHQPASAWSRMAVHDAHGHDTDSDLVVQALAGSEGGGLPLPAALADGLHTVRVDGDTYRTFVKTLGNGQRLAVSQDTEMRDEIAQGSALRTILPLLILVPVLLLVVTYLVRKMLRPVTLLSAQIDARSEQDVQPLAAANLPSEMRPFVRAINRLLSRVGTAMDEQRRFVADAAHELRSPLTALSLQAERLGAAPLSPEAAQRLATLRQGIERGRHLLEQLLSLARVQSADGLPAQAVSVRTVYRRVLEDLMPLAEARGVDIGMADGADVQILAHEVDVYTLVRNLLDNAIRYTPEGGRVDLAVSQDGPHAILEVEDSGVGIPVAERQRVLDPFYRVLGSEQIGSGLGLSIASTVAQRLGGRLELLDATQFAQGLKVRVVVKAA